MIKSKKGSVMLYAMMVGLVILLLALALAPSVIEFTNSARNSTSGDTVGMDCDNESISNFDKAGCTVVDLYGFYFIGGLILIGGAFITAKIIFSG